MEEYEKVKEQQIQQYQYEYQSFINGLFDNRKYLALDLIFDYVLTLSQFSKTRWKKENITQIKQICPKILEYILQIKSSDNISAQKDALLTFLEFQKRFEPVLYENIEYKIPAIERLLFSEKNEKIWVITAMFE